MEPNQIKDADFLDILFEGRNKEYGAYELRKTYPERIKRAMMGTWAIIALLCLGWTLSGAKKNKAIVPIVPPDFEIANIKEPDKPLPVPPVQKVEPVKVEMKHFATIKIVPDDQAKEAPPENKDLDDVKIGTANQDGMKDDGIAGPPVQGAAGGIVSKPEKQDDDDGIFRSVEIESSFPGGTSAWARFLQRNLRFPDEAMSAGISGAVMVQFIVDRDGNISDVTALSGPDQGGLREEAIRVIKKSGKWVPAQQNGRYVKSYKRQPVVFQIANE